MTQTKIFVYGMLKAGNRLNHLLEGCPMLYASWVRRYKIVTEGGICFMVPSDDPKHAVYGEVYEVNPKTKELLDYIEQGYALVSLLGEEWTDVMYYSPVFSMGELPEIPSELGAFDYTPEIQFKLLAEARYGH